MNYEMFRKKVSGLPVISWQALEIIAGTDQEMKNQLTRWKNSGKLIVLKKKLYILNSTDRKINPSRMYISGELCRPSYISMEYALSYYGIIPERTADVTCITSKKTQSYDNCFGVFSYRHIKPECFTGFTAQKDEAGLTYFLAEPEKAVVDFIYLNMKYFKKDYLDVLRESYRFGEIKTLKQVKLLKYSGLFGNKKLYEIIKGVRQL